VVNVEDGTVIGVVSSKLAPLPAVIESALSALEKQVSGMVYTAKKADGTKFTLSEGQVIGAVLQYLRSQTQLVIGYAVPVKDLREFLKKNGVSP
jgi:2-succinyl-5-enolpyruvyl-6-hydroxy-3-cyclohexene-1-carboxylate synthase